MGACGGCDPRPLGPGSSRLPCNCSRDGGRHNTRAEAVGANARALKLMAGELECPVLLLSQFSREQRKDKRYRNAAAGRNCTT